jgi:hypothetical protein
MDTPTLAKNILKEITEYHEALVVQARGIGRVKKILTFVNACITFAEKYITFGDINFWNESKNSIEEFSNRVQPFYLGNALVINTPIMPSVDSASGTIATTVFGLLTDNYRHFEDNITRLEFAGLAEEYKGLLSGPQEERRVSAFLEPVNSIAYYKFENSLESFESLKENDDPQGSLMEMRSAIDLAIEELLKLTPLTKKERGDLQQIDRLPVIAQYLSKDEIAKVDLILANNRLSKLLSQLSASKQLSYSRIEAEALISQATAILSTIATSIKSLDNNLQE